MDNYILVGSQENSKKNLGEKGKPKCLFHDYFLIHNIRVRCQNLNCPKCWHDTAASKVGKVRSRLLGIKGSHGHRSCIIHLAEQTTFEEIRSLIDVISTAFRRFDNKHRGVINFVLHDKQGERHLNVGLASWYLSVKNLIGYFDVEQQKYVPPSRKHRLYDYYWLQSQIEDVIGSFVRRVEWGKEAHWNNHIGWLRYCLRVDEHKDKKDAKEGIKGVSGHAWRLKKK